MPKFESKKKFIFNLINAMSFIHSIQGFTLNQETEKNDSSFTDYTTIRAGKNSRTSTREETVAWGQNVLKELNYSLDPNRYFMLEIRKLEAGATF